MTIRYVCEECKVSESVLSNVETGRMIPYDKLRKRLSKFYNVPEGALFKDIDMAQRYLAKVAGQP
jgi:transcriptional regulator with XRE-family HTH domain